MRTGQLDDDDWGRLSSTMGLLLEKGQLYIDDASGLAPTEFTFACPRRVAVNMVAQHDRDRLFAADAKPSLSENRTWKLPDLPLFESLSKGATGSGYCLISAKP